MTFDGFFENYKDACYSKKLTVVFASIDSHQDLAACRT
jgi:hypothetical protein